MASRIVTILAADLSSNLMSRVYILAKLLEPGFEVHVVGPGSLDRIWAPIRSDQTIVYRPFQIRSSVDLYRHRNTIARKYVEGDLIYALKPVNTSFGIGLAARAVMRRPLVLDIEEWELGLLAASAYWEARLMKWRWLRDANSPLYTRLLDRRVCEADAITVSNSFLQGRYGGMWLPHARGLDQFPEELVRRPDADEPTVIFCGSVRAHKGVDLLLKAWELVDHPTAKLRVVGIPPDSPMARDRSLRRRDSIDFVGAIELSEMPHALSAASVVVIPQRSGRASMGQLPTRLIDAMAAGRTIVSTRVGDIPMWLRDDAGIVVDPDDVEGLAAGIRRALDDPQGALRMGMKARERFLNYASFDALRPRVFELISGLISGRPPVIPAGCFVH